MFSDLVHAQFRFADWKDIILLVIGILCAIAFGVALPLQIYFLGDMMDLFINDGKLSEVLELIDWTKTNYNQSEVARDIDILG